VSIGAVVVVLLLLRGFFGTKYQVEHWFEKNDEEITRCKEAIRGFEDAIEKSEPIGTFRISLKGLYESQLRDARRELERFQKEKKWFLKVRIKGPAADLVVMVTGQEGGAVCQERISREDMMDNVQTAAFEIEDAAVFGIEDENSRIWISVVPREFGSPTSHLKPGDYSLVVKNFVSEKVIYKASIKLPPEKVTKAEDISSTKLPPKEVTNAEEQPQKTFYEQAEEDRQRFLAEPKAVDSQGEKSVSEQSRGITSAPITAEKTTTTTVAVDVNAAPKPTELYFTELSEIYKMEAKRLLNAAVPGRSMGRLPTTGFGLMVDNCRQIIQRWPDSWYAYRAKQLLVDMPPRFQERYKVTKEELDLIRFAKPRPGTKPFIIEESR